MSGLQRRSYKRLVDQLDSLVEAGNSVIVVEHDMDVVAHGGADRPEMRFLTLTCPRCVPPSTARDVVLDGLPWCAAPIDPATKRYRCPACGGQVRATFHGGSGGAVKAFGDHLLTPLPST